MKYVDLEITLPDELLHPIQAFIRQENAVEYEEILAWRVRLDRGVEYALYYVEGDLGRYREALAEIESVLDDEASAEELESAFEAAQQRGITGVPTFVSDGHAARGAVPPEQLKRLVEGV